VPFPPDPTHLIGSGRIVYALDVVNGHAVGDDVRTVQRARKPSAFHASAQYARSAINFGKSAVDVSFIDLDILLTRIRHAQSRVYFLDAVKAYNADFSPARLMEGG
jgi:hypothetical protein